jgi:hypothetical protein
MHTGDSEPPLPELPHHHHGQRAGVLLRAEVRLRDGGSARAWRFSTPHDAWTPVAVKVLCALCLMAFDNEEAAHQHLFTVHEGVFQHDRFEEVSPPQPE